MPLAVVEVRAEVCGRCDVPCEKQNETAFHSDPCAQCPRAWRSRWGQYGQCANFAPPPRGLGDLVASIAQPIAKAIDSVARTKIAECGGCKKRQAMLNRIMPNL
jgi:hypothetical protein